MPQGSNRQSRSAIPQVDTTTYGHSLAPKPQNKPKKTKARKSSNDNAKTLMTRRTLLFGALGVGAVAAGAAGVAALSNRSSESDEEIITLSVAEEDVWDLESCTEVDPEDVFELVGNYELPFGTLLWVDDEEVVPCLLPTEEASPLVTVAALSLSTGNYFTVLEQAVGAEEGFEVYDVRGNSAGFVWMESAIMEGLWRIYVAPIVDFTLGTPVMVDEGDRTGEVPTITVSGDYAFWQTMAPVTNENARREPSAVKRAHLATGEVRVMLDSVGRMNAPITASGGSVIFSPRHEDATSYCDLVCMDAETGRVQDRLTLPQGMFPNQIGYGPTGFAFCFESIYDYGGGIANLGTYTPASAKGSNGYDGLDWFRFNRSPSTGPCWCTDNWFMVKSNQSVCAVNLPNRLFCSLGVESGCLDWGDYLVSSGKRDTVVSAMQIDQVDNENKETKMTQVRVWRPVADAIANATPVETEPEDEQAAGESSEEQPSEGA